MKPQKLVIEFKTRPIILDINRVKKIVSSKKLNSKKGKK